MEVKKIKRIGREISFFMIEDYVGINKVGFSTCLISILKMLENKLTITTFFPLSEQYTLFLNYI